MPAIKDAVVAACSIGALVVASLGLKTWHRQMHGQSDHALAKRVLVALYRVRDRFDAVRGPWMPGEEIIAAAKKHNIDIGQGFRPGSPDWERATNLAHQERYATLVEAFEGLRPELFEATAAWGSGWCKEVDELYRIRHELWFAIRVHNSPDLRNSRTPEQYMKDQEVLYDMSSSPEKPDAFKQRVNAVIESAESQLAPMLRRKAK